MVRWVVISIFMLVWAGVLLVWEIVGVDFFIILILEREPCISLPSGYRQLNKCSL